MNSEMRNLDTTTSSMDVASMNNLVVSMRPLVKRVKVAIIHKHSQKIKLLRNKKGTDDEMRSNSQKADRMVQEIQCLKSVKPDLISKFSLGNTTSFEEVAPKGDAELRAYTRMACHKFISAKVLQWRSEHEDWKSLAAFIKSKNTGRRFKSQRAGFAAASYFSDFGFENDQIDRNWQAKDTEDRVGCQSSDNNEPNSEPGNSKETLPLSTSLETDNSTENLTEENKSERSISYQRKKTVSSADSQDKDSEAGFSGDNIVGSGSSGEEGSGEEDSSPHQGEEDSSNHPGEEESSNYPREEDSSYYPREEKSSNYPREEDSSNYPQKEDSSNYPQEEDSSNYPQEEESSLYPESGSVLIPEIHPTDSHHEVTSAVPEKQPDFKAKINKEIVIKKLNLQELDKGEVDLDVSTEPVTFLFDGETDKDKSLPPKRKRDNFFDCSDEDMDDSRDVEDTQTPSVASADEEQEEAFDRERMKKTVESTFLSNLSSRSHRQQGNHSRSNWEKREANYKKNRFQERKPFPKTMSAGNKKQFERQAAFLRKKQASSYTDTKKAPSWFGDAVQQHQKGAKSSSKNTDDGIETQKPIHPSWEASKKRKAMENKIQAFQGKKTTFDDD